MTDKMEKFTVLLNKADLEKLSKRAESDGLPISAYIRRLILQDEKRIREDINERMRRKLLQEV